jgi:hypothetical protein
VKAFNLYSGGTTKAGGNMMIEPGQTGPALIQGLLGFTPSQVAASRERTSSVIEYTKWAKARRQELINKYATTKTDHDERLKFNHANPDYKIMPTDIFSAKHYNKLKSKEAMGKHVPGKRGVNRVSGADIAEQP